MKNKKNSKKNNKKFLLQVFCILLAVIMLLGMAAPFFMSVL